MSEPKYKWVPVEPTQPQLFAMQEELPEHQHTYGATVLARAMYKAALEFSPSPPQDPTSGQPRFDYAGIIKYAKEMGLKTDFNEKDPRDEALRVALLSFKIIASGVEDTPPFRPYDIKEMQTMAFRTAEKIKELLGEK